MVSRRNYFNIIMMMAVLLFMFQFSQIIKENASNYGTNEYAEEEPLSGAGQWQGGTYTGHGAFGEDTVVFLGDGGDELGGMVCQWCAYTKRRLAVLDNTGGLDIGRMGLPGLVLIDSGHIDFDGETGALVSLAQSGVPLVFCNLPGTDVLLRNEELTALLGISQIKEERVQVEGIHLFDGFLLGGEAVYKARTPGEEDRQDLELDVPWYVTGKGTKTYMVGMMDEARVKQEELPRLIWRNSYEGAMVFAVNGDYMSGLTGLGFLNAMLYEMKPYTVYPVVNAQNMLIVGYPVLAPENAVRLEAVYSRDPRAVMRDVMWPGIAAMSLNNKLKLTCCLNTKYNYLDAAQPEGEELPFYLQQLREIGAEAGRSFDYYHDDGGQGVTLQEKLRADQGFYDAIDSGYLFSAAYFEALPEDLGQYLEAGAELKDIRTIAFREGEQPFLLSYCGDAVTLQGITGEAGTYSYSVDLQMRSLATALGYSNTLIDMHNAMWPESVGDQWEIYFDRIFSNVSTYWTRYTGFEQTALSESDRRVRGFLNLDYGEERDGDKLTLRLQGGGGEAWFVLRLHGEEIAAVENGESEKLESGAYLLHTEAGQLEITFRKAEDVLEYSGAFAR